MRWTKQHTELEAAHRAVLTQHDLVKQVSANNTSAAADVKTMGDQLTKAGEELRELEPILATDEHTAQRNLHRLNNTLTAYIALAALAREEATDAKLLAPLNDAERAARAMATLGRELSVQLQQAAPA